MKTKKLVFFACLLSLLVLPYSIRADEPRQEKELFSQSQTINHTIHELESLFVLMQERLALMHEVARYKWNAELLNATLDAEKLTLLDNKVENESFIASFFDAQNEAAQRIQFLDFSLFEKEKMGPFEDVKDFESEIYPKLKLINEDMLVTVNQLLIHTQNESLPEFLKDLSFSSFKNEGINREIYDIAIEPLFMD